ncbi:PAAR domain-containing protein [Burkholderia stabilis]|uniref:PAAR domain-containing protein n=1 Tax=Burkholderia stabilis TaxID=95485 RepID=UPI001F4B5120|nr:PAAR domain-containing protein [Burkholderia stabilis]
MSRKFILKGDTTDHGGVVIDGIANSSFDGRELAYLGGAVFCAACKSPGVIVSDGGERTMTVMGKVVALEHDLCQCLCTPQPKLIPSQATGTISG